MSDVKYEIKRFGDDLFGIMCSDCPIHEIEWWEDTTLEELHSTHAEELEMDASIPDWAAEEMWKEGWKPVAADFDEWLKQSIKDGYIRVAA